MRCLVTGANGFLGRHCVAALAAAGNDVVALSRGGAPVAGAAETMACDLLDADAARTAVSAARAQCLIHLAWHADPRDRWHTPANLDWLAASVALARAFAEAGGARMVFGSTSAVYDWTHERLIEDETPLRPATLYGAAKAAVELALGAAAPALGLEFAAARIFFCYGPGEPSGRLVRDLVDGLAAGRRVACTDGVQERDFLHATDIGAALAAIAVSDLSGPINVASGEATAVRAVIGTVARIMDGEALVDWGAVARAPSDPALLVADVARLVALGFVPRYGLESGVRDTVAAMLAEAGR